MYALYRPIPPYGILPLLGDPYLALPRALARALTVAPTESWPDREDGLEGCHRDDLVLRRVLCGGDGDRLWDRRGLELGQVDLGFHVSSPAEESANKAERQLN